MVSADDQRGRAGRARSVLAGIAGVLLLMWPALINGAPFFFSDTSSYVRAGDAVAHIAGGARARTIWTRDAYVAPPSVPAVGPAPAAPASTPVRGNMPEQGTVMAGRSPYFGLLLWLGWVTGHFWTFVAAQGLVAYVLIGMALRRFGLDRPGLRLAMTAALSVLTPLAIYNGVLLADALSGFGIAALLLILAADARRTRGETLFLWLLLLVSVVSHLTHFAMIAAMTLALLVCLWRGWGDKRATRAAIVAGVVASLVGIGSVMATSWAIERKFGKPPMLVPLITARFVADGPGRDYIAGGCDGRRFAVCTIPQHGWTNSDVFLWASDPKEGGFLTADLATRERMSKEDKAFALAVLRTYPVRTTLLAVWNSLLQIGDNRVDILDEHCFAEPACIGDQFPPPVVRGVAESPAGRNVWPVMAMSLVVYAGVLVALAALAIGLPRLSRRDPASAQMLAVWLGLVVVAILANGFLGGAISEPQSRYQARMEWLVPLIAGLVVLRLRALASQEGR